MKNFIFQLVLPLIGVVALLGVITALNIKSAQACSENTCPTGGPGGEAQTWKDINDGHGGKFYLHISGNENPSCSTGMVDNLASYQGGVDMYTRLNSDGTGTMSYPVKIRIFSENYYCTQTTSSPCFGNPSGVSSQDITLNPGQYFTWHPAAVNMNMCGTAQWDMSFQVLDGNNNPVYTAGSTTHPGILPDGQAYWTTCTASKNGHPNSCGTTTPTPTPTATPTPSPTPTPTPTPGVTVTPTPSASCEFSPSSLQVANGQNGTTNLIYTANNLASTNTHATICISQDGGTPNYVADTGTDVSSTSIAESVTGSHTYAATVYLKSASDDPKSCSGTTAAVCAASTQPTVCTTPPTCQTAPAGCSYQGADACTCGQLVCVTTIPGCSGSDCNITVNVTQNQTQTQQQQQQQQMVLAATVAPVTTTTSNLPSTGAGFEVLGTLFALIPAGFKLRKLV